VYPCEFSPTHAAFCTKLHEQLERGCCRHQICSLSLSLSLSCSFKVVRACIASQVPFARNTLSFAAAIFFGWIIRRIINTSRGRRARASERSGAAARLVPSSFLEPSSHGGWARVSLWGNLSLLFMSWF
jgi:hypothetical protein